MRLEIHLDFLFSTTESRSSHVDTSTARVIISHRFTWLTCLQGERIHSLLNLLDRLLGVIIVALHHETVGLSLFESNLKLFNLI